MISAVEVLGRTPIIFTLPIRISSLPRDSLVSGSMSSSPKAKTFQICPTAMSVPSPRLIVICLSLLLNTLGGKITSVTRFAIFPDISRAIATSKSSFRLLSLTEYVLFSETSLLLIWKLVDSSNFPVVESYIFPTQESLITRLVALLPVPWNVATSL